jgi:dephospho-CoA kinase
MQEPAVSSLRVVGIVGGIASGKSQVADCFRRRGAAVLDADGAGHRVLAQPEVVDALVKRWGQGILDASGQVSRKQVAAIVFAPGNEAERTFLNQVTHPRIGQLLADQITEIQAANQTKMAILDAALLLEAGWDEICDLVLFLSTLPTPSRLARAQARGWDQAELARREATQLSLAEKRRLADVVLDNSGSLAELQSQVDDLISTL